MSRGGYIGSTPSLLSALSPSILHFDNIHLTQRDFISNFLKHQQTKVLNNNKPAGTYLTPSINSSSALNPSLMATAFVMQNQVLSKFAGFQDLASPIRPDAVPMLNALQMIQTYQDFHLQQQDTVNNKTEAVTHILAQIDFVQHWDSTAASACTAYADRLLQSYDELAPAKEELRCIEQVLLPDVLEQAMGPLKQNQRLLLAMKE